MAMTRLVMRTTTKTWCICHR